MTVSRLLARPLLASIFVAGPVNALKNTEGHATKAKKVTDRVVPVAEKVGEKVGVPVPHDPAMWVRINAGVQLAAAIGLATGKAPRISSALLAGSLVPTTLAGHRFWEETDPAAKTAQRIQFFKNLSLLGGLLIASGDTDGKPGVAWRARHAAKDAKRAARQEARLLKAKAHLG
jgi:putative oxidoreductase